MGNIETGKRGEEIAVKYLQNIGYSIIETNFRKKLGEIDIIAEDKKNNELVFIEVKTRISDKFGYPEEAVNKKKIEKIILVANNWINVKEIEDKIWRIDIIAIELRNDEPRIKHIKDISLE